MRVLLLTSLLLITLAATPASAEMVRLEDVVVTHGPLVVSFVVKGAFKKDIVEAIDSGIPTSFTFIINLTKVKTLWLDDVIGSWRFNHTVRYDTLKEVYEITLDETGRTVTTKDPEKMKELMVTGVKIVMSPLPSLKANVKYELRLKAELDTIDLPFFLDYMFFFVKLWDFETSWYSHRFTVEEAAAEHTK